MDKLTRYRRAVLQLLSRYAQIKPAFGDVKMELIADTEHDYYQLVSVDWDGDKRIHGCSLHLDICDGQVWVQHNGTEIEIGEELMELGVAREDIVLGFLPPQVRQFSAYGIGAEQARHQGA